MRGCPHRTPPSSSYSHSPSDAIDISLNELALRIAPNKSLTQPHPQSPHLPSYISLLPPEILTEIFTYCSPNEKFPVPCRTSAPLLLTWVCSLWRSLAISTPELWTALHINYKDPAEDIPAANLWLSRSRNRPLTLSIAIDFAEQPHQEILDTLCTHSKRWKHVRFDFCHLLCPPMYSLALAQGNVPQLSKFEFHARSISNINVSQITHLLYSAPKLKAVSWVDDLADTETLLDLPLHRLTRLSLAMDHGTLDYLKVLQKCLNLEHIMITRPLSQTTHIRPPLYLSKLSSLNISSDLTSILDHLILPALQDVRIYCEDHKHAQTQFNSNNGLPPWNPIPFLSLIDRSACAITSLEVSTPLTEDTLLTCLACMSSSLVKLSVKEIAVGDALLHSLTRGSKRRGSVGPKSDYVRKVDEIDNENTLCPRLEEINLHTHVDSTPGSLAHMVQSRLFQSVFGDPSHEEDRSWSTLGKIRIIDGHVDLRRLHELSTGSHHITGRGGIFTVDVIPKKSTRPRTRNFFYRKKLCASR